MASNWTVKTEGSSAVIRHIVMFSAKRRENVETIYRGLKLLEDIPSAHLLEVSYNQKTDQLGNDIDVIVYGEFADANALADFKAHDLYHRSISIVRPLRDMRVAADYEVPGPSLSS
jgi:hypothetical protein